MAARSLPALALLLATACSFDLDARQPPGDGGAGDTFVAPTTSALASVVRTLTVPSSASIGFDLDGDGKKDNQGAAIFSVLQAASAELDLQAALDEDLQNGDLVLLFDLLANGLGSGPARLRMFQGSDDDGDPSDNFSGSEPFSVAPGPSGTLDGAIAGDKLSVRGTVVFPVNIGDTRRSLFIKSARVEATVRPNELVDGVLGGAISERQLDDVLLPDLAEAADRKYKDPNTSQSTRDALKAFDGDKNGTITAAEMKSNGLIGALLRPDVDLDGDGSPDAISIAYGFSSIQCVINSD